MPPKVPDQYEMPFGKYKGQEIGSVPASYLDWLAGQDWIGKWHQVDQYIKENRPVIDAELEERELLLGNDPFGEGKP